MTTAQPHHPISQPAPSSALALAAPVVVRWVIEPRALVVAAPSAAVLNGHAARLTGAAVEWRVRQTDGVCRGVCVLMLGMTGGEHDEIVLADAVLSTTSESELEHLDAPGMLSLTLRSGSLVYARTGVLQSRLGLAGGVYEAPTLVRA